MNDTRLLREFAENGSETAFTSLVNRHLDLVYSAALRRLGDPHAAQDLTQKVFCLLAQKAGRLGSKTVLVAWLHRAVCLAAAKYWRTEYRRRRHELEAARRPPESSTQDPVWMEFAPHLDDALNQLADPDRLALLLRFFQGKPFNEIGHELGLSEDAARMRVNRALERLRRVLPRDPVVGLVTTSMLEIWLPDHAVEPAPFALAGTIRLAAHRGTQSAGTISFLAGLLAWLTREKLKVAGFASVATLLVGVGGRVLTSASIHPISSPTTVAAAPLVVTPDDEPNSVDSTRIARPLSPNPATSALNPTSLTARELYERGQVHQREKRDDEALADFSKAVDLLDQGNGRWEWFTDVYFTRASLYADKKEYTKAIADYTRMLEFEPRRYEARFNRGLYYTYLHQLDNALADFSVIIDDSDTDYSHNVDSKEKLLAMTYEYRGKIYQERKDYSRAVADYTESLRLVPSGEDSLIVYWRRGRSYAATQQFNQALADANHLSNVALKWALGDETNSDQGQALTAARFGSEIFEHRQIFQLEVLAATHARAGDYGQAVRYQQQALELSPSGGEPHAERQARLQWYQAGQPLNAE